MNFDDIEIDTEDSIVRKHKANAFKGTVATSRTFKKSGEYKAPASMYERLDANRKCYISVPFEFNNGVDHEHN